MQKKSRGRPPSPHSIRAKAKTAGLSERSLYYAREIMRSGREDLVAATQHGEMTIGAAIRELRGTAPPDRFNKLVSAWNRCSDDEQLRFLRLLLDAGIVAPVRPGHVKSEI